MTHPESSNSGRTVHIDLRKIFLEVSVTNPEAVTLGTVARPTLTSYKLFWAQKLDRSTTAKELRDFYRPFGAKL